nr:BPK_HP1_G0043590.mRNA.1.CDS.1 [Saccharomyces cerevisiae]
MQEEYYKNASSYKRIPGIRTPFIALHAQDDPIVGGDLPIDQIKSNPLHFASRNFDGGACWMVQKDRSGRRWYAEPLCRFSKIFHDEITVKGLKPDLENVQLPDPNCEPHSHNLSRELVL